MGKELVPLNEYTVGVFHIEWDEDKDGNRKSGLDACSLVIANVETGARIRLSGLDLMEKLAITLCKKVYVIKLMRTFLNISEEDATRFYDQGVCLTTAIERLGKKGQKL